MGDIFGGIEGGATLSTLALVDAKGKKLCEVRGPPLNHLLEGSEICHQRIFAMIKDGKKAAKIPETTVLTSLGLCLTGCEDEIKNRDWEYKFLRNQPAIARTCVVTSDTVAPLYAAGKDGGLILIAGTGSNAFLMNPDNTTARCGGWGHLIGDEASAMWISLKAVKTVFNHEDNFIKAPHDIGKVKQLMLEHFDVQNKIGILEHCYNNFDKSFFAGLCVRLATAAIKDKDPLCKSFFYDAGKVLADVVAAILPKVSRKLLKAEGGLPIVCVGSVFKSWELLKPGFEENTNLDISEYTMLTLNTNAAVGAAYYGALQVDCSFPIDYDENICPFYHYKKEEEEGGE